MLPLTAGFLLAGPLRIGELAARAGVALPTMSRIVDGIVQHGWAQRQADQSDHRACVISITAAGEAIVETVRRTRITCLEARPGVPRPCGQGGAAGRHAGAGVAGGPDHGNTAAGSPAGMIEERLAAVIAGELTGSARSETAVNDIAFALVLNLHQPAGTSTTCSAPAPGRRPRS